MKESEIHDKKPAVRYGTGRQRCREQAHCGSHGLRQGRAG
jgi:hypothetical protein